MIEEKLAAFADHSGNPGHAMDILRLSLLDWCAVGIAGGNEPVAHILRDQVLEEGGANQASLIGVDIKVPACSAALVNGAISHALDYDDTHFAHIGHPSVAIIPAALAVAQMVGCSGRELQEAALIGAEASIRMGVWLGRSHYQTGFHQTATAGAFGACLAACRLLSLSHDQTIHALGLVSTRASGLQSQFGTMGKSMNAGIAARNGVEAALLARRGFVSRATALDGPQGFGPTHQGEAQNAAWDGIGQNWLFERVEHKFHACCHGLHAMLEALPPRDGIALGDMDQIEITTHPRWLSVCNIEAPATDLEAKFSYRMTAAMRLLGHDTSLPGSFTDSLCGDGDIVSLREKVTVMGCDRLSEMQVRVVLRGADGSEQVLTHDLEAPLPYAEREARVSTKAAALIGAPRARALWQMICDEAAPNDIAAALTK
ncbi:MmgE/PrpD family protein [Roseovarius aestuarii]|uniref:2-methylcitrate dehydratase n=1 Tax=Roseovarius aestuarii TaxID=475083 RepID=A0A1X7BR52_9RHOB|nr:MmgE/PrpD family protein [Roseovarius aestuarii]SMC12112.1 2-methylcitrate dehydratase [Roseovarius aestuarii]